MPSVVIRKVEGGRAVSWELSSNFGELCHLFTLEEFRGQRLGILTELALAQKFARKDERAFKYVVQANTSVVRGTLASPYWSIWRRKDGSIADHIFTGFNRIGGEKVK